MDVSTVKERRRRSKVLPLTIGPHGSEPKNICDVLRPGVARNLNPEFNGEKRIKCAFV